MQREGGREKGGYIQTEHQEDRQTELGKEEEREH